MMDVLMPGNKWARAQNSRRVSHRYPRLSVSRFQSSSRDVVSASRLAARRYQ